jgi:hypothetical protein
MTRIKTIPSTFLNDPSISLGAKGLYCFINAKGPLWVSNAGDIASENKNTPESIEMFEEELLNNEYMERKLSEEKQGVKYFSYTLLKKSISKKSEIHRQDTKKIVAYWNAK